MTSRDCNLYIKAVRLFATARANFWLSSPHAEKHQVFSVKQHPERFGSGADERSKGVVGKVLMQHEEIRKRKFVEGSLWGLVPFLLGRGVGTWVG